MQDSSPEKQEIIPVHRTRPWQHEGMFARHDDVMTYTWDAVPSPIGLVVAVFEGASIISVHVTDDDPLWEIERLTQQLFASPVHSPGAAHELATQIDEYFDGERTAFDLPLDWRLAGEGFSAQALLAVTKIPYGETASYGEIAVLAGRPRAARAVGTACRTTPFSLVVPVHRVIRSDGSVGEYGSSPENKKFLIAHEQNILNS